MKSDIYAYFLHIRFKVFKKKLYFLNFEELTFLEVLWADAFR